MKLSQQQERFVYDLFAATYRNPFGRGEVHRNEALIEVHPFDGGIHISEIRALALGHGAGTRALQLLTSLADQHGVRLDLNAVRIGKQGMTNAQLRRWYQKHGFVRHGGVDAMKREPQPTTTGEMK